MIDKVKYRVLPDIKIIIEYFNGAITLNDIIENDENIVIDKQYNLNYNSIISFRDAQFMLSEDNDIINYINFVNTNSKIIGKRKVAFLTSTPDQVALLTIYEMLGENLPMTYNIFSTMKASLKWVGVSISYIDLFEKYIEDLKNSIA